MKSAPTIAPDPNILPYVANAAQRLRDEIGTSREGERRKRAQSRRAAILLGIPVLTVLVQLILWAERVPLQGFPVVFFFSVALLAGGVHALTGGRTKSPPVSRAARLAVVDLAATGSVLAIGPLLEAHAYWTTSTLTGISMEASEFADVVRSALRDLLRKLTRADSDALRVPHLSIIHSQVQWFTDRVDPPRRAIPQGASRQPDLIRELESAGRLTGCDRPFDDGHIEYLLALVGALEIVGNEESISCLDRLARLDPHWFWGAYRVKRAAQESLPRLRERLERQREDAALLRPAPAGEENLLRVTGNPPEEEQTLLRPHEG